MAKLDQIEIDGTLYEVVPEIAPLFSTSVAYAVGDCVIKDAVLYRFKTAHAAGAWIGTDADAIEVGKELTGLKQDLTQLSDLTIEDAFVDISSDVNWNVDGYYNNGGKGGTLQETSKAKSSFISVTPGEVFRISGVSYYNQKLICLYATGNDTPVTMYPSSSQDKTYTDEVITIPDGISEIGLSYYYATRFEAFKLEKQTLARIPVEASETDLFEKNTPVNLYDYTESTDGGYFEHSTGNITSNSGMCYAYVPVSEGNYIITACKNFFGTTGARIPYFGSNKNYLGWIQGTYGEYVDENLTPCTIAVNKYAKYIGISTRTYYKNRVIVQTGSTLSDKFPVYFDPYTALKPAEKVNAENVKGATVNPLFRKTVAFDGDSIGQGYDTGDGKESWAEHIGPTNEMNWKNYSVAGGTITNNHSHCILEYLDTIHTLMPTLDYYIFDGGTNDADRLGADGLGTVTADDYSGTYDTSTFSGAFETLIYNALTYYPKTKIGYIVAQKMGKTSGGGYAIRKTFFERAKEICVKWGVPYIDLWDGSTLNPNLESMYDSTMTAEQNVSAGKLYTDGQHLTPYGYDVITPIIEAWMRTL